MASTKSNPVTRRRRRQAPWLRLVKGLAAIVLLSCAALGAALWWEDRPLREIERMLDRKEFVQALEMANRYLKESPNQSRALDQKARALAGMGRWNEANRLFDQNGVISTSSQRAWADALLHEQRWTEALPLLAELNREFPNDADILHELAACQGQLGYFDESIAATERLVRIPEHERRGRVLLGMLQYRRGNNRLAIQAWAPLLEHDGKLDDLQLSPAELLLAYGRALLDDGRPAEAAPQLKRAIEVEFSDEAGLALAEAYDSLGNRDGAVELWTKVVEHTSGNREAREGLARTAMERKSPAEALQWLAPLLERDDLRSSTMHLARRAATMAGDNDNSAKWERQAVALREREKRMTALEQALRDSPRSFWSRCFRAHKFASQGNLQQALVLAEELQSQKPDEPFVRQLADAIRNQKPLPSLDLIPLKQH